MGQSKVPEHRGGSLRRPTGARRCADAAERKTRSGCSGEAARTTLPAFLPSLSVASLDADPDAKGLPAYVQREFYDYLQCGILAHGFLRLGCDTCKHEMLLAFSCKRRGFCPSCAGRRMAQTAAHLVERVIPWVPTRQWVVSVPIPLRYWMASSKELTAQIHTIIHTTISQYYVKQAVKSGVERQQVQPGSVTFIQRFGGALNLMMSS
jgi:hypothetical protein